MIRRCYEFGKGIIFASLRGAILLYLGSCLALPYVVENEANRIVTLSLKSEDEEFFKTLMDDGVVLSDLPSDRSEVCNNGKIMSSYSKVDGRERGIFLPPASRVCFITRENLESSLQSMIIEDGETKVSIKGRFDYFRTWYDTVGKFFVYRGE